MKKSGCHVLDFGALCPLLAPPKLGDWPPMQINIKCLGA